VVDVVALGDEDDVGPDVGAEVGVVGEVGVVAPEPVAAGRVVGVPVAPPMLGDVRGPVTIGPGIVTCGTVVDVVLDELVVDEVDEVDDGGPGGPLVGRGAKTPPSSPPSSLPSFAAAVALGRSCAASSSPPLATYSTAVVSAAAAARAAAATTSGFCAINRSRGRGAIARAAAAIADATRWRSPGGAAMASTVASAATTSGASTRERIDAANPADGAALATALSNRPASWDSNAERPNG
jgi:hypothetical protein